MHSSSCHQTVLSNQFHAPGALVHRELHPVRSGQETVSPGAGLKAANRKILWSVSCLYILVTIRTELTYYV